MRTHLLMLAFVLLTGATSPLLGCSGGSGGTGKDAQIIVPDAPLPDGPTCSLTDCDGLCVDTTDDKLHCGSCTNECKGGQQCVNSACACPTAFAPTRVTPSGNDQIRTDIPNAYVAAGPFTSGSGIHIAAVGYARTGTELNRAYTLNADNLGTPPFAGFLYKLDLGTFNPEAIFYSTAGTLTFTQACDKGASGTLTNATFKAVESLSNPTIDANACSFSLLSLTFSIGKPEMCPPANM